MAPANQKKPARVAHPHVIAETNTSQKITCESYGEALDRIGACGDDPSTVNVN